MTTLTRRTGLIAASLLAATAFGSAAFAQTADINIGISLSTTGPAAALGIPEKNSIDFVPKEIGGVKLTLTVLDDGGDPTAATTNARRMVSENKVDILIGSSITPTGIAMGNVATEAGVPHLSLAPMPIPADKAKWTVVMPQPVPLMAKVIFAHMKASGAKTVGMIGFSDSWGDLWAKEFAANGAPLGLSMVADERYARADTSVTGQALKLVSAKPDVILVAASGTGAALPQIALRERGYTGKIYQTHGAVSKDFIRIAGKTAEGVLMASGPVVAAEGLAESSPVKKPAMAYVTAYEAKYGKDSRTQFGAHMYDAFEVLKRVIPTALKTAKPGTPEFKEAIRAALLTEKEIAAAQGVYNFTATDRYGVDDRARVLITVKDGAFAVVP